MHQDKAEPLLMRKREVDGAENLSVTGHRRQLTDSWQAKALSVVSSDLSTARKGSRSRGRTPSKSPQTKRYDPERAEEHKALKKKEREELYHMQNSGPQEPILLIRKREVITKVVGPGSDTESLASSVIIKKTDKSKYVDVDYETARRKMAQLAAEEEVMVSRVEEKPSFVLQQGVDYTTERIIKIEGTEYLPKGFIELEPLLFKNEYEFNDPISEKLFDKDQRKTKELRRQQYINRNLAKIRDVTIIKIEYLKERANKILEQWFAENASPMDKATIEKYADELELDPETFEKMHKMFIEDRTLFGRDNHELNKLLYNDKRQQSLSKITPNQNLQEEPVTKVGLTQFKQPTEVGDRYSTETAVEKKRRSKLSRQRQQHRSKSHDRESRGATPPVPRRESSQVKKLQDKASRMKAEEQRLRAINQEAIRGEEEAKLRMEAALCRRKQEDSLVKQLAVEEYDRAKREAEEYAELRKTAEAALRQIVKQREQTQHNLEEQTQLIKLQAEYDIGKAREVSQRESREREEKSSAQRARQEKQILEKKQQIEREKRQQELEVEATRKQHEIDMVKADEKETTKQFTKKTAVTLIRRELKEEQVIKHSDSAHSSGKADLTPTKDDSPNRNSINSNSKTDQASSSKGKSSQGATGSQGQPVTEFGSAQRTASGRKEEQEIEHKSENIYESEVIDIRTSSELAKNGPIAQTSLIVKKSNAVERLSHMVSSEEHHNQQDVSLSKNDSQDYFTGLAAAEEENVAQSDAIPEKEVEDSFATFPKPASADNPDHDAENSVKPENYSDIDYDGQGEQSFSLTPVLSAVDVKAISQYDPSESLVNQANAPSFGRQPRQSDGSAAVFKGGVRTTDTPDTHQANQVDTRPKDRRLENAYESYGRVQAVNSSNDSGDKEASNVQRSVAYDVYQDNLDDHGDGEVYSGQQFGDEDEDERERSLARTQEDGGTYQCSEYTQEHIEQFSPRRSSEAVNYQPDIETGQEEVDLVHGYHESAEESRFGQAYNQRGNVSDQVENGYSAKEDDADQCVSKDEVAEHGSDVEDPDEPEPQHFGTHHTDYDLRSEVQNLLEEEKRKIEERLRQEYEEKMAKVRQEAIEETLLRKDTYQKICRKQLWDMFLEFCKEELPHDVEFQKKLMTDTFVYFLQKKFEQRHGYFEKLDEECNQLIREEYQD